MAHNIFEIFNISGNFVDGTERLTKLGEAPGRMLAFEPACLSLRPSPTASTGGGGGGGGTDGYAWGGFRQSFKYFNDLDPAAVAELRATLTLRNATLVRYARDYVLGLGARATPSPTAARAGARGVAGGGGVPLPGTAATGAPPPPSASKPRRRRRPVVVGVHVRSGMSGHKTFGGCLPNADYFLHALAYYRRRFPPETEAGGGGGGVVFVYAAEEKGMAWFRDAVLAKDPMRGSDTFPIETTDPIETFAVLSHCDASVFSFGTYGWFAAWLAGGPVTYSRHLAAANEKRDALGSRCGVVTSSGVGVKDHIPPDWVVV